MSTMLAIDIEEPLDEVERIVNHSPFSRIPVYEGSIDNIIGVLQLNHFYKKMLDGRDFELRDILTPACFGAPDAAPAVCAGPR